MGATETDYNNYIKALKDAGLEMLTDAETNEVYGAYDYISGVLIQFAYSTQTGYQGIVIFAYLASEPFVKTEGLPSLQVLYQIMLKKEKPSNIIIKPLLNLNQLLVNIKFTQFLSVV